MISNLTASIASSLGITVAIAWSTVFIGVSTTVAPSSAYSAEQIRFWYPPVGEFTIHISDLEKFAKEGKLTKRLEIYLGQISPQQQMQFREALLTRYDLNHLTISQFTYSPIGEILVKRLGRILQISPTENGFSALRASLILSAKSKEGLTALNILQQYPVPIIYLDLPQALQVYAEASQLIYQKEQAIAAIEKQAISDSLSNRLTNQNKNQAKIAIDLRVAGDVKWTKEQFTYLQSDRNVKISTDLYLPTGLTKPAPLIVISHGFASNPDTFQYLSQHLASHGFAVAVLEHPQTGSRDFGTFRSGLSKALESEDAVQRPRDITYLLDILEQKIKANPQWRDRFTTEQVGLIGHSLGGYTVLSLSGGQLNFNQINQECSTPELDIVSFNISKIVQCEIGALKDKSDKNINLRDRRVKSVLAINPLGGSTLFGKEGIQNIKIPIAIFASGDDWLTPAVSEQFFPFVWLTSSHKYLVTFPKGTHFSFLERSDRGALVIPESILGEKPEFTHPYAKALSLAFFQSYLNNRPEFTPYLDNSYLQTISNSQFPPNQFPATLTTNFSEPLLHF